MKLNGEKLNFENSILNIAYRNKSIPDNITKAMLDKNHVINIPVNSLSEAENKLIEFAENHVIHHAVIENEHIRLWVISGKESRDHDLKKYAQKRYRDDHGIGDNLTSLIPLLKNITNAILEQKDFSDVTMSLKEISEIYQSVADKFKERYEYQKSVNNEFYKRDDY